MDERLPATVLSDFLCPGWVAAAEILGMPAGGGAMTDSVHRPWREDEPRESRIFLLCDSCGTATAISDPPMAHRLAGIASAHDFAIARGVVEMEGRCRGCGPTDAESAAP